MQHHPHNTIIILYDYGRAIICQPTQPTPAPLVALARLDWVFIFDDVATHHLSDELAFVELDPSHAPAMFVYCSPMLFCLCFFPLGLYGFADGDLLLVLRQTCGESIVVFSSRHYASSVGNLVAGMICHMSLVPACQIEGPLWANCKGKCCRVLSLCSFALLMLPPLPSSNIY